MKSSKFSFLRGLILTSLSCLPLGGLNVAFAQVEQGRLPLVSHLEEKSSSFITPKNKLSQAEPKQTPRPLTVKHLAHKPTLDKEASAKIKAASTACVVDTKVPVKPGFIENQNDELCVIPTAATESEKPAPKKR